MRMLPPEEISHMYTNTAEQNIEISTKELGERIMRPQCSLASKTNKMKKNATIVDSSTS